MSFCPKDKLSCEKACMETITRGKLERKDQKSTGEARILISLMSSYPSREITGQLSKLSNYCMEQYEMEKNDALLSVLSTLVQDGRIGFYMPMERLVFFCIKLMKRQVFL